MELKANKSDTSDLNASITNEDETNMNLSRSQKKGTGPQVSLLLILVCHKCFFNKLIIGGTGTIGFGCLLPSG